MRYTHTQLTQFIKEEYKLQLNLSIADILYSEHLVIVDRFSRNQPNLGQTFIADKKLSNSYNGHTNVLVNKEAIIKQVHGFKKI